MFVLWLSQASNAKGQHLRDFVGLARDWSACLEPLQPGALADLDAFEGELECAGSLLITFPDVVVHEPWRSAVVQAVRDGKRCLVIAPDTELNRFLFEFDLAVHTGRLVAPAGSMGDERLVEVLGAEQPVHPLAQQLLRPQAILGAERPSQVWCGAGAQPFLVAPAGTRLLGADDLFQPVPPGPLCCGGLWPRADVPPQEAPLATGAGLVLVANTCLFDPTARTVHSQRMQGLERLSNDMVCWLLGKRPWQPAATRA
ncbi:MAG: hypothetical protein ACKOSS_07585 [Planctomycetia bacterium]